ncbi:Allantoicase, partial [Coemansia sp. RSA 2610]
TRGWKTRRSRSDDHSDWAIVRLGEPGFLTRIELDTLFYDGDQPVSASVQACYTEMENPERDSECFWYQIVPRTELNGNKLHKVDVTLNDVPFSHIKLVIHPDGGISRLRAFGQRVKEIEEEAAREKAEASAEAALAAEIGADVESSESETIEAVIIEAKATVATSEKSEKSEKSESKKDESAQRKKSKKADKQVPRKKKSKGDRDSNDGQDSDQFSSRANEILQSITSPLPKKRTRAKSRAGDDSDDGSVQTTGSQAKRSRRKAKPRNTPAA